MDGYFLVGNENEIKVKIPQDEFDDILKKYPKCMYFDKNWGTCLKVPGKVLVEMVLNKRSV